MELGKAIKYKITIDPSHNMGFIVKIGCGVFVANDPETLIIYLAEYVHYPEKWEKEYNKVSPDVLPEAPPIESEDKAGMQPTPEARDNA